MTRTNKVWLYLCQYDTNKQSRAISLSIWHEQTKSGYIFVNMTRTNKVWLYLCQYDTNKQSLAIFDEAEHIFSDAESESARCCVHGNSAPYWPPHSLWIVVNAYICALFLSRCGFAAAHYTDRDKEAPVLQGHLLEPRALPANRAYWLLFTHSRTWRDDDDISGTITNRSARQAEKEWWRERYTERQRQRTQNSAHYYSRIEILGNSQFLQSVLAKLHRQHI